MNKKPSLIDMPIAKALSILTLPIILTNFLQIAYNLTDSFWVGKLWTDAISATTIASSIIFLTISIWSGFATAWSILISQYFWAKDDKNVAHIAAQSLLMIFLTSLVIWILWYIFTPEILSLMKLESWVIPGATSFLKISFLWLVVNFLFFMFQSIMRWIWKANLPIYIVLATVLFNFILDPFLIYWYSFFPEMWVSWAAWATLITQTLACIAWFVIMFSWKFGIHITLKDYIPDLQTIKKTFLLWVPSSIEMTARSLSFTILTALVASFWSVATAAYWVSWNFVQIWVILAMSISIATSVLVGQHLWASNFKKAKEVYSFSMKYSFIILTVVWILLALLSPSLIHIFAPGNTEVIKVWAKIVRISCISFWFIWIQMSINWVLRSMGNTKMPMYLVIVGQWIIKLPLAYILAKYTFMWVDGIWWSDIAPSILLGFVMLYYISKVDWTKANLTKKKLEEIEVIEELESVEVVKEL